MRKGTNYTRDKKKLSQTEMWGSAITDHAMQENHLIDWESAQIIEKEREMTKLGGKRGCAYKNSTQHEQRQGTIPPIPLV